LSRAEDLAEYRPARAPRHALTLTLFHCCGERRQARIERFRRTDLVLTIRLSRIGKKKKPFYRVVVIERTRPRDGRVKEAVGTYDPLKKPAEIKLDAERIKYWMGLGAQPSDTVRSFLRQQKIA
jgi:small subunit ribosomal protein S16